MSEGLVAIATAWVVLSHLDLRQATPTAPENCIAFESSYHIEKGCQCLVMESQGENQGVYSSPNYPSVYPQNITCLLLTLIGDLDEIVQVTFKHFDLTPLQNNECMDYVRLYLDLDRPEISDPKRVNYNFCGSIRDLPQETFYSSKRSLILEFHTQPPVPQQHQQSLRSQLQQPESPELQKKERLHFQQTQHDLQHPQQNPQHLKFPSLQHNRTGFQISYRFLNKTRFELEGGTKRYSEHCIYDFYSSRNSKTGRFFSPLYPQSYPPNSVCHYVFHAGSEERVVVKFLFLRMSRDVSNRKSCSGDFLRARDGNVITSKEATAAAASAAPATEVTTAIGSILGVFCGLPGEETSVTSTKEQMVIEFTSGSKVDAGDRSFGATVQFVHKDSIILSAPQSERPSEPVHTIATHPDDPKMTSSGASSECLEEFISVHNKSGYFVSPHYPKPFPIPSKCRYIFRGQGLERIQISFIDFNIGNKTGRRSSSKLCEGEDSVTVSVLLTGESRSIAVFCGEDDQSKLPLMSNDNQLELFFTTSGPPTSKVVPGRGFKGQYHFVTDFGIKMGEQDKRKGCYFQYHSSRYKNGSITSPNYPGLYPRSSECFYYFYANKDERVTIEFRKFDIEGFPPSCLPDTQSDYLEYSDSALPLVNDDVTSGNKLCGTGKPEMQKRVIISEGSFLRLTFVSNDVYDATGFHALFFFKKKKDISLNQKKRIVASSVKSLPKRNNGSKAPPSFTSSLQSAIFFFCLATVSVATTKSYRTIFS